MLEKNTTLYEVLFRFDENGALKGAHAQYLETISEDGAIIQAKPGGALPLSLLATADGLTVKKVLGDALASVVEAKEAAEAAAAAALVTKEAAEAKAKEAEAAAADALAKVEAVAGQIAMQEQLEAKDANIQVLMVQLEAAKAITP